MIVAFLYASVGHGGGSGYIAIMSIFNVAVLIKYGWQYFFEPGINLDGLAKCKRGGSRLEPVYRLQFIH